MGSTTLANIRAVWGRSGTEVYAAVDNGDVVQYNGTDWSFLTA